MTEPKTKTTTGTWRCQSGDYNSKGKYVIRYDSGEQTYTRRVQVVGTNEGKNQ